MMRGILARLRRAPLRRPGRLAAVVAAGAVLGAAALGLREAATAQEAPVAAEEAAAGKVEAAAEEATGPPIAIGVLPFERVGPPGAPVPDAARRLADLLGARGVSRVVGPEGFSEDPNFEPTREQVQDWGARADVASLVVGRVTRIGQRISLDLRLRAVDSGTVVSTHVAEAARPEELDAAVDRLADQIVRQARGVAPAETPSVGARPEAAPRREEVASRPGTAAAPAPSPPASQPPAAAGGAGGAGASGQGASNQEAWTQGASSRSASKSEGLLGTGRSDEPINIRSGELEAFDQGGERRFVFRNDVRVRQGNLRLTSQRLEAFYPPGSSQPQRLEASGDVVLLQEGREAHCDRATYLRVEGRVLCFGDDALLIQGEDRVRGKEIQFDLDTERLVVRGGADVQLQSSDGPGEGPGGS